MTCRTGDEEIQKLLDGMLTAQERARLDAHLISCDTCRQALAAHRLLARVGGSWARPTLEDDPGEAFNAQVLMRIAAQSSQAPASSSLWLPLLATACLIGLLAFLPNVIGPGLEALGLSARQMPDWLLTNLRLVPEAAATVSHVLPIFAPLPGWTWSVLLAIVAVNGIFYRQACLSQSRRSLP
jgi:anti-sigma factor RsiW